MKRRLTMLAVMAGLLLANAVSAFAVGGVLSDGQGTNWSYGHLYGQGTYYLQNWGTTNMDGSGITNIPLTGVNGLGDTTNALQVQIIALNGATTALNVATGSLNTAVGALNNATNVLNAIVAELNTNALRLTGGTMNGNIDLGGTTVSNGAFVGDGGGLTNVTAVAGDDVIKTNDTAQSKAGMLTLNGGLTVGATNVIFTPSATQTLAGDANVVPNAAIVAVVGDGGAVTCGMEDGWSAGQLLTIRGTHADNTVTLTNAAVVPTFKLAENDVISFMWNGTAWVEMLRRDN